MARARPAAQRQTNQHHIATTTIRRKQATQQHLPAHLHIRPRNHAQSQQSHAIATNHTNLKRQEEFDAAAAEIRPVEGVSWDDMLEMYALYKQALFGDNTTCER